MDRNTISAFLLIAIILIFYPIYLKIITPEKPKTFSDNSQTYSPQKVPIERKTETIKTEENTAEYGDSHTVFDLPSEEKKITINSNLYQATVSNLGGGSIISFKLKNYLLKNDSTVNLIDDKNKRNLYISFISIDGDLIELKKPWETDTPDRTLDVTRKSKTIYL